MNVLRRRIFLGLLLVAWVPFVVNRVSEADMPVPGTNPLTQLQGKVPGEPAHAQETTHAQKRLSGHGDVHARRPVVVAEVGGIRPRASLSRG